MLDAYLEDMGGVVKPVTSRPAFLTEHGSARKIDPDSDTDPDTEDTANRGRGIAIGIGIE
jgi:hypothetical protein